MMRSKGFTPLEKATDEVGMLYKSDGDLKPPLAHIVREQSSLTGFTLIEVLVAALLLSLIAAGSFGAFVGGKGFVARAGHKTEAINRARERMEELKNRAYAGVNNSPSPNPEPIIFFGSGVSSASRAWAVTAAPEGRRVEVSVTWTAAGVTETETIVTLVTDPG